MIPRMRILFVTLLLASCAMGQDTGTGGGTAEGSTEASTTAETTTETATSGTEATTETTGEGGGGGGETSEGAGIPQAAPAGNRPKVKGCHQQSKSKGSQPATCDPCMKKVAAFRAAHKKNPKNVVQTWTSLCNSIGLTGKRLSECRKMTDTKLGREVADYNLGDPNVTPQDICSANDFCRKSHTEI